jgi:RHS repeat-associated protein
MGNAIVRRAASLFTGKERDTESGNDYFGARYYASSIGRWLSPDWSAKVMPVPYAKLNDPQSLNLYTYAGNNPLIHIDADGHCWPQSLCSWVQGAFGTAVQVWNDGAARVKYYSNAMGLSGDSASVARDASKVGTRPALSPIGQAVTTQALASKARQERDAARALLPVAEQNASANRTNAALNQLGDASEAVGAAGMIVAVASVAADTAQAPDGQKAQTAVKDTVGLGGSLYGAGFGAAVGAQGGPWGAFAGSLIGGFFGQETAEAVVSGVAAQEQDIEIQPFQPGNIPGSVN